MKKAKVNASSVTFKYIPLEPEYFNFIGRKQNHDEISDQWKLDSLTA